jgi:hypothetical protein
MVPRRFLLNMSALHALSMHVLRESAFNWGKAISEYGIKAVLFIKTAV